MSEEHELPSDSDDDDEDYIPNAADAEAVSEVESEGDLESEQEEENDENKRESQRKKKKKGTIIGKSRKKKPGKQKEDENKSVEEEPSEKKKLTEEEEKKRADSLWADFMKDTGMKPKPQNANNVMQEKSAITPKLKVEEKVKITKVYEFAGEEVKVEKEVLADSAEARLSLSAANSSKNTSASPSVANEQNRGRVLKRAGLGGISSVLGLIGKKAKISTLEKSKLDWDNFKKQENLEEEISTHNKGKDGYIERQDFLQRADLRQFEIEKQLRNTNRRSTR